jgi:hypothetical protein
VRHGAEENIWVELQDGWRAVHERSFAKYNCQVEAGYSVRMGQEKKASRILWVSLKERDLKEDEALGGLIILKWILVR